MFLSVSMLWATEVWCVHGLGCRVEGLGLGFRVDGSGTPKLGQDEGFVQPHRVRVFSET